jgi:cell division protein FtsW
MKKSKIMLIDKPLLIMIILYSIIGIFAILSASSVSSVITYGVSPYYFFMKQIIIVLASFIFGFLIILKVPTKNYKKLVPWIVGGTLFLLVYVLLRGKIVNSAKSWINLGFIKFRPSELAKI